MASATDKKDSIGETIKTVVYALLIAGVFRTLFFQPFWIPSGSMKDTILIGDFVFVNKMAYGYSKYSCPFSACPIPDRLFGSEPERGDIPRFLRPKAQAVSSRAVKTALLGKVRCVKSRPTSKPCRVALAIRS